ncbi:MAG: hypothetical protein ACJ77E_05505 [Gaiellaceae bacterium]
MEEFRALLGETAAIAASFYDTVEERPVCPRASVDELRAGLGRPLSDAPADARTVIAELAAAGGPRLVAEPSGRYFGFVTARGLLTRKNG